MSRNVFNLLHMFVGVFESLLIYVFNVLHVVVVLLCVFVVVVFLYHCHRVMLCLFSCV